MNLISILIFTTACLAVDSPIRNGLRDLMKCLGSHSAKYEYKTREKYITVKPVDRTYFDTLGEDKRLDQCTRSPRFMNSMVWDTGYYYESDDSQYSGPVGNALEPLSDDELSESILIQRELWYKNIR